jgi:eukaryotic-like serine/threonine-protein kinase
MLVGQHVGPILIEKELGSGAMGAVYRGVNTKTGQKVAVKVISPGLTTSQSAVARFDREAKILKQLNHQNIVRFFGTGTIQGQRCYAMEYIEGESLDHVMARRGRMTWEEVVDLGQQLCAGLQHAHERGVVHRDLKPSNLMVCHDGTLKLTDFGIAKLEDATQLTEANCTVGTAAYMSPEQCRGERNIDYKSDLYSLGVLFYELITGRKPFKAESAMEMFVQHVQGKFERPSRIILDVPVWLDTLVCQMMEKKPAQRPQNAAMVANVLGSIQEKIEAQQSAGVAAVRGRKKDRPKGKRSIDEEDKEAARILAGKAKKKLREKVPFFLAAWFQAACILALLAGIGVALYLMLRPPSAETLYERAEKLMASTKPEDWDMARRGPIETYMVHYPDRPGRETEQMRLWLNKIDIFNNEQLLLNYLRKKDSIIGFPPKNDTEKEAFKAVLTEEEGDLDAAEKLWMTMKENYGAGSGFKSWGQLAEQHVAMIQDIQKTAKNLGEEANRVEESGSELPMTDQPIQEAFRAFRYDQFKDPLMARRDFNEMREKYAKDPEQRFWYVLAGWKIRELNKILKDSVLEKNRDEVLKTIKEKLEVAGKSKRNKRIGICLTIIALYEKELPMKEQVDKAQNLLAK